ncbi:hypothetical protein KC926_00785 [Candidatus Kaiserbacteria bacterium]|nr:hypothetical protein [Candidatus Kaiserbacteria bacterium]
MSNQKKNESGFALLMTLIVVGVVLSVGLTILDLSLKQVRLSTNAKESEIAFHAANAGMECAQYWRRASSTEMEAGSAINPVCFNSSYDSYSNTNITGVEVTGNGNVYQYQYDFTWGVAGAVRCTQVNTLIMSADLIGAGLSLNNVSSYVDGYPDGNSKACSAGSQCSIISVRGYNRPCNTVSGYGVVQREVLLQF